jgi:hypothetical protein
MSYSVLYRVVCFLLCRIMLVTLPAMLLTVSYNDCYFTYNASYCVV